MTKEQMVAKLKEIEREHWDRYKLWERVCGSEHDITQNEMAEWYSIHMALIELGI